MLLIDSHSKDKLIRSIFLFFLLLYFALGIYLRIKALDIPRMNEWLIRDFERAFNLLDRIQIPLAGPETSGGGRLPGPILYFISAFPLIFDYSFKSIYVFNCILNIATLILFFFVVKRYFGFTVSFISSTLLSINLLHVDSVSFPINPTFIFPFLVLILWPIFEFFSKNNQKFFPLIFLFIALGSQIHFSIATYYLVPLIGIAIFRIKIKKKIILLTIAVLLVCHSPYIIHKQKVFEPEIWNPDNPNNNFILNNDFKFQDILKIILFQTAIKRISLSEVKPPFGFSQIQVNVDWIIYSVSIYGLIFLVLYSNFRKKIPLLDVKRETILLLLFIVPSLIYGIFQISGWAIWYVYIFLPPVLLISGTFINHIYRYIGSISYKYCLIFVLGGILIFFTYSNLKIYKNWFQFSKSNIEIGHYKNLNKYKQFISILLRELQLTPKEFFERVFFEGYSPRSLKLLKFIGSENKGFLNRENSNNKNCYYLIEEKQYLTIQQQQQALSSGTDTNLAKKRIDYFLSDKSINFIKFQLLSLIKYNFLKKIRVYEYIPKNKQPCYQNSFNQFAIEENYINLSKFSHGLNNSKLVLTHKTLNKEESYDNNLRLISLYKEFLIFDKRLQTPIRLKLQLDKTKGTYKLNTSFELFSFWGPYKNLFNIKEFIVSINPLSQSPNIPKEYKRIEIISPNTWISENTYGDNDYSNKLQWFREIILPGDVILKKGDFKIDLIWNTELENSVGVCCSSITTQINKISLIDRN
jgi:hypothetical protein